MGNADVGAYLRDMCGLPRRFGAQAVIYGDGLMLWMVQNSLSRCSSAIESLPPDTPTPIAAGG